jgi:hypothetical protein
MYVGVIECIMCFDGGGLVFGIKCIGVFFAVLMLKSDTTSSFA